MRLTAPCQAIDFRTSDIHGNPFQLSDHLGKRVLLSFFRDAGCPFCNLRVYELTHNHKQWLDQNLEVIAVFSDTPEQVRRFVSRHPRPFTMLADPDLELYNWYGIQHSATAMLKALLFKFPRIIRGLLKGARPSNNPHVRIVPADFLIAEDGRVAKVWYGRDTSDHIPLSEIQEFVDAGRLAPRPLQAVVERGVTQLSHGPGPGGIGRPDKAARTEKTVEESAL